MKNHPLDSFSKIFLFFCTFLTVTGNCPAKADSVKINGFKDCSAYLASKEIPIKISADGESFALDPPSSPLVKEFNLSKAAPLNLYNLGEVTFNKDKAGKIKEVVWGTQGQSGVHKVTFLVDDEHNRCYIQRSDYTYEGVIGWDMGKIKNEKIPPVYGKSVHTEFDLKACHDLRELKTKYPFIGTCKQKLLHVNDQVTDDASAQKVYGRNLKESDFYYVGGGDEKDKKQTYRYCLDPDRKQIEDTYQQLYEKSGEKWGEGLSFGLFSPGGECLNFKNYPYSKDLTESYYKDYPRGDPSFLPRKAADVEVGSDPTKIPLGK